MTLISAEKQIIEKSKRYEAIIKVAQKLLHDPAAETTLQYCDSRMSRQSQQLYGIGYIPDDENINLLTDLITIDILLSLGLSYTSYIQHNDYKIPTNQLTLSRHNLIIPYRDIYGNIKGLVGRCCLGEEERKKEKLQKYKYTRFTKSLHCFGLYEAKQSIIENNAVVLVEGQLDCISMCQNGVRNVVAIGGCYLLRRQFQLLSRYTDTILLLLDNDDEGKRGVNKIISRYNKQANIRKLSLPTGYKDPDEFLKKYPNAARQLLAQEMYGR